VPGLTIPHLVDLGPDGRALGRLRSLAGPEAWDELRGRADGPFALPDTREAWEAAAGRQPQLEARMRAVSGALRNLGAGSVASYGAGTGLPELWLHRVAPELRLTLTEVAPTTAARLSTVFAEATVVVHDLRAAPPLAADVHLFHRIDTEFSGRAWRRVFRRFAAERIVVVATEVLSPERARTELRHLRMHWREGWQRAGWIRTVGAFEALWRATHVAERTSFGDLDGWVLRPRRG
jgi:hypothetical protein